MDDYPTPAIPLLGNWSEERDHVQTMFNYNVRSYMETVHNEARLTDVVEMAYLRGAILYYTRASRYGLKLALPNEMLIRARLEGYYGE